ncbi:uncharacterized protein LOC113377026 [Ctenocephalides felis]|uniref:uncharacterized protein LOC113377026 n=1 Tax=Ctenocephalides felis TaxID=7515 RepID=UPI000E6E30A1|nr:uncharacterized protein LOC113377026 [Ctenocephalides felis]
MAPNVDQPVKKSPELSECSPLLENKIPSNNYDSTTQSPLEGNQQKPIFKNSEDIEGQYLYTKTSCKCKGRFFSIGAIGLIFLGGMTVGCYLLNQYDHEWVTNTPFELVDRRNWQLLEFLPRVRISRSETKSKDEDQLSRTSGWESSSASGSTEKNNKSKDGLPLFQEVVFVEPENSTGVMDPGTGKTGKFGKRRRMQPATYVVIAHTEGPTCYKKEHCLQILRQLHAKSISVMGLLDIPYNFLIGGDGHTYEGRGWHDHDALKHSLKNHTTLSVALIGDFTHDLPPKKQLEEAKAFIIESIRRRKLSPNYYLVGHRQINKNTKSPGDALMEEITGWRHWQP